MPLHGKIVVIKRTGGDGTEFPLTAACLFGRKPDCDIRIQLPQVSKEHCRIDFNENKEIILTNLSSANPTLVNGEVLQQSERLKHGDVITVIDRSFRFEYPPAPTPKKRSSIGGKTETLKVLQNHYVGDSVSTETGEKRISEVSTDPHLKDGTNHENIQRPLEKTVAMETKEGDGLQQSQTASPFNDLYQMIRKSLDVKTPRKSSASVLQTPASKFCTPKPASVWKNDESLVISTEEHITPKKAEAKVSSVADEAKTEAGNASNETPKSVKKQRRSFQCPSIEMAKSDVQEAENAAGSEATSPQKRIRTPPKRFTACEVVEQISATPKSPVRRRSKEAKPAETKEQEEEAVTSPKTESLRRASPRSSEKVKLMSKKRKSEELGADLPTSQMKKKRVSFGGSLCPELFDKRLPPNSPLRKGADPRRSLCVTKPKQSLLRRASAIGLLQDKKGHSGSPKTGKTSPKSRSPKTALPKSRTPSPKAASPAKGRSPTVRGRFSVSHISTPEDAVTEQVSLVTAAPLRRTSTSRETPGLAKVMRRRNGISRASMKVKNSWAEIVRFGQTKTQVVAPAKKTVTKKTMKKTVSKPQTPVRKLNSHFSTGHADSPVTIVVGRAHKQEVVQPTGAAPKLVPNIALLKKNMKMDKDLTGISEMLKNPANERRRRSVTDENDAPKTLVGSLSTSVVEPSVVEPSVVEPSVVEPSVVEPSVLNTPEEKGEMMVSPLSVSSTVKDRSYNSEAVQRLFDNDQEPSIVGAAPAVEDSSEQQRPDVKTTSVATPNQKPELPECLTGVKRMMRTPRQKAEPIEDLRGKILKTPKQKPENQECLTGVKRMMATPRREAEPVEDIEVELLTAPKQKPEELEGLTEVKSICETPQPEAEPLEAPKAQEASEVLVKTPAHMQESEDLSEIRDMTADSVRSSPLVCLTDGKSVAKTPEEKSAPVEDVAGVKRLVKTPKVKAQPVEEKTPRLSGDAPVEELMEEPLTEPSAQPEANEVADQTPLDCDEDVAKELVFAHEEPRDDVPTDVIADVPQDDKEKEADANEVVADFEELPSGHDDEPSDAVESLAQAAVDEKLSEDQPEVEAATIKVTEMETTAAAPDHEKSVLDGTLKTVESLAADAAEHGDEAVVSAPVRGRRGKKTEATAPPAVRQSRGRNAKSQGSPSEDQPEIAPENAVEATLATEISTEAVSDQTSPITENESTPPEEEAVVKPTRRRKPKQTAVEPQTEPSESVPALEKPKRGRKPKPDAVEQNEVAEDTVVAVETKQQPQPPVRAKRGRTAKQEEEKLESSSVETVNHEASGSAAPLEKAVLKPKRGRKAKQPEESVTEQQDVLSSHSEDVPQADATKEADAMETAPQAPVTESLPEVETATSKVTEMDAAVQKKSGRGRKVKPVESNSAEAQQEAAETCDEAVVSAPVRGRRGKKTEATAPPAVRQSRGRNAKSQESPSEDQPEIAPENAVEATLVTEISTEAVSDQTSPIKENESTPPEEEAVVKPTRRRKPKQTAVEPQTEPSESVPALEKPKRGRKPKPDAVEQNEVAEDTVVAVETKQQPQPPVRAKRGRTAKQEEEKLESSSADTTKSQEPAKKLKRTRKAEQDHVEPREEAIEVVVPEEAEAPLVAEPVKMNEQAAKPKRGRKATEVSSTDKLKRGTRGKRVTEEVGVTSVPEEKSDHELEAEEKKNSEPDVPVVKQSRARGTKTSIKNEVSQAVPAKRARRGAAPLAETNAESTVQVSEPVSTSVEPAKRGRRAAAKPAASEATVTSEQAEPTEDLSKAVAEDTNTSKRSVKWKAEFEVFEIPKATPVKAVRGRKSKLGGQVDAESKTAEEEDLSDKAVEVQPVKRTRRGPKVADVTADEAEATSQVESVEAPPKTRRGRAAKK